MDIVEWIVQTVPGGWNVGVGGGYGGDDGVGDGVGDVGGGAYGMSAIVLLVHRQTVPR